MSVCERCKDKKMEQVEEDKDTDTDKDKDTEIRVLASPSIRRRLTSNPLQHYNHHIRRTREVVIGSIGFRRIERLHYPARRF